MTPERFGAIAETYPHLRVFQEVVNLISDLTYTWIDPRIDFERREV